MTLSLQAAQGLLRNKGNSSIVRGNLQRQAILPGRTLSALGPRTPFLRSLAVPALSARRARLRQEWLDAEQQRLVRDYQPVSQALTAYEVAYREWRSRRIGASALAPHARFLERVVARSLRRLRRDPATGTDAGAKALLVAALEARHRALRLPPASAAYRRDWNRSVVDARRALTLLQNLRDRARLIPLPEDAIS